MCGLVGGTKVINEPVFHNYHEIKDRLIPWNEIFNQEEDYYFVYFYSETCGHCNDIKQDVLNYYFESINPMYFVCTNYEAVIGPKKELYGIDNIDEFYIFGTPFMIEIKDHTILDYYAGTIEILEFISI